MLTDDEGIRSGAIWGLGFMAVAVAFIVVVAIGDNSSSRPVRLFATEIGLFLVYLCAVMHIRGFVYLGSKLGSVFLKWSSFALCATLILFCLTLMAALPFTPDPFPALEVFVSILLGVAGISFFIAMATLYKRLGVITFLVGLNLLWVYFVWFPPWGSLLFIPSAYLLFRESNL
mgnify:CR=1